MTLANRSIVTAAGLIIAMTGFARAQAPTEQTIQVRCSIAVPSGVTKPLTMMAQIYQIGRNNLGQYVREGEPRSLFVPLMPGESGTGFGTFDTDLAKEIEYEFRVVPLDANGNERTDGRYEFVSSELKGDLFDKTFPVRPGVRNEVIVNLRWIPKDQQIKSNFVQIVPNPGGPDYLLSLYLNDPTGIDLNN